MKKFLTVICIAIVAATLCLCFAGCNQSTKISINPSKSSYTVGIVQLVNHPALDAATQGFKDALTAELEKEGRTVVYDYQNATGDSGLCTTIANNFVSKKYDLIMANATAALQAASGATLNIPILGTSITEYGVALELTDFNGVIGNNVSGTSDLAPLTEQAKMMVELLPNAKKIALFYCSAEANSKYQVETVKAYLEGLDKGITADLKSFADSNEIDAQARAIVGAGYQAVYIPTDNTAADNTATIDAIFGAANIPVFAGEEGICAGCGFATLSISYYNIGVKTGKMAAEVLLGKTDITKLAIQYDEEPVKKYVKSRCEQFGVTVTEDYEEIVIE